MRLIHEVIEDLRVPPDPEMTPMGAALEELLGGERGAGIGKVIASWIGNGPNLPIGTRDLRRILGEERVEDLATPWLAWRRATFSSNWRGCFPLPSIADARR
jgi:hypothetical protein